MDNLERQILLAEMLNEIKKKSASLEKPLHQSYTTECVLYGLNLAMEIIENKIEEE